MNIVIVSGNIATDLELRATTTGNASLSFNLAVYDGKDKDGNNKTIFIPCAAWEENAERIAQTCTKGSAILIFGRWERRTYEKDGQKRYYDQVRVNKFEYMEKKAKAARTDDFVEEAADDTGLPF